MGVRAWARTAFAWMKRPLNRSPSRDYLEWLAQTNRPAAKHIHFNVTNPPTLPNMGDLSNTSLHFDNDLFTRSELGRTLPLFFDKRARFEVHDVTMHVRGPELFLFSNCNVTNLHLKASSSIKLNIRNCWIGQLTLRVNESDAHRIQYPFSITIDNCWIGRFKILSLSILTLKINGGGILSVGAPPSYDKNPFYGEAALKSVFVPKRDAMYLNNKYGSSPWTNVRHHLISSGNLGAAGLFHTAALSIDRRTRRLYDIHRWIGAIYEYAGEYGSSISRPFLLLIACWILGVIAYYVGDGAAIANVVTLENWREVLDTSRFWRVVYLSTAAIFPFSVLLGIQPVEPSGIYWYLLFISQRLISVVLLFLGAIAIRRQFRLSTG